MTNKLYDPGTKKEKEKISSFSSEYHLNSVVYSPFKVRTDCCNRLSQLTGSNSRCSTDAYFARNPFDIDTNKKLKKTVYKKGPETHSLNIDETSRNRGQENTKWSIKAPRHWKSDRSDRTYPINSVEIAREERKNIFQ